MEEQEPEVIESTGPAPDPIIYTLPDGKKVRIGENSVDFFEKLQKLPVATKIKMMQLTEDQMMKYILEKKKSANKYLMELLEKKWYWRESGDEADFTDYEYELGIKLTPAEVLKKCKSKRPLQLDQIEKIIGFYTGDKSSVYLKESE